jgi:hypothetical protein
MEKPDPFSVRGWFVLQPFLATFALSASSYDAASIVPVPNSAFIRVLHQSVALESQAPSGGSPRLFVQCTYRNVISGVIWSDGPLTHVLCHFEKCHPKSGSAGTCATEAVANLSTFEQLTSESSCSMLDFSDNRDSIYLVSNAFQGAGSCHGRDAPPLLTPLQDTLTRRSFCHISARLS